MRSLLTKDPRPKSDREVNIITSIPSEQEDAQKLKSPSEANQPNDLHDPKTMNSHDTVQLLESFQKMKAEEQRLVELKQKILAKQYDLQNALAKEMEKMKAKIANLASEIPELENKTQKLGDALGMDNFNEDLLPKMDSPLPVTKEDEALPDCVGLINCSKPEKCLNYDSCLKNYVAAEIRNEIPRL
jgi:hypothetical protein